MRRDFFQVPNDQDAQDAGIRDVERERDAFINFSWMRTLNSKLLLTISPFYHYTRAAFIGGPNDTPVSARDERGSQYGGAQIVLSALTRHHNAKAASMASPNATPLSSVCGATMATAIPSTCSNAKTRTEIWPRSLSKISTSPCHG